MVAKRRRGGDDGRKRTVWKTKGRGRDRKKESGKTGCLISRPPWLRGPSSSCDWRPHLRRPGSLMCRDGPPWLSCPFDGCFAGLLFCRCLSSLCARHDQNGRIAAAVYISGAPACSACMRSQMPHWRSLPPRAQRAQRERERERSYTPASSAPPIQPIARCSCRFRPQQLSELLAEQTSYNVTCCKPQRPTRRARKRGQGVPFEPPSCLAGARARRPFGLAFCARQSRALAATERSKGKEQERAKRPDDRPTPLLERSRARQRTWPPSHHGRPPSPAAGLDRLRGNVPSHGVSVSDGWTAADSCR